MPGSLKRYPVRNQSDANHLTLSRRPRGRQHFLPCFYMLYTRGCFGPRDSLTANALYAVKKDGASEFVKLILEVYFPLGAAFVRGVGNVTPKRRIRGISRLRKLPLIMLASKRSLDGWSTSAQ